MNIQLISGQFQPREAIEILTMLILLTIKHYEAELDLLNKENDKKKRLNMIKHLQKELFELTRHIDKKGTTVKIETKIEFKDL